MTRQLFDQSAWVAATGGAYAGRGGGRPMRQPRTRTKAFVPLPSARQSSKTAQQQAAKLQRKNALTHALISTLKLSQPELRQSTTTIVPVGAYWRSSPAERLRTLSVLQRFHGPR